MRRITQTTELGLGGSLRAILIRYQFPTRTWFMQPQQLNLPSSTAYYIAPVSTVPPDWPPLINPVPWFSFFDALSILGSAADGLFEPSDLPEGGFAVRCDGTTGYLQSPFGGSPSEPGLNGCSFDVLLRLHAYPGVGIEPALMGGSTGMALTVKNDGRIYGYYNGSAVVDAPLPLNTPTQVTLTRAGSSPDLITLWVNGVTVDTATPARGSINWGQLHWGKHWANSHYADVTYSYASVLPFPLAFGRVAAHAAAAIWTDTSMDVRDSETLAIERGIRDVNDPTARVAGPSTCTLALDNSDQNSAKKAGYYSPGHVNCRPGFAKGVPMRVTLTPSDGAPYTQFVGRVRVIAPTAGTVDDQITRLMAFDWLDDAGRYPLTDLPLLQNVRASEVIAALVSRVPNQPPGIEIDDTTDIFRYALHNAQDEKTAVLAELARLEQSELGYVATLRTGFLRCENRARRFTGGYTPLATLSDFLDIDVVETGATTPNRVLVTAHPTVTDPSATTVLYALTNPLPIGAGATISFTGPFRADSAPTKSARIGGVDTVVPSPTTDYLMNTKADGIGTNLTPFLTATPIVGANTVTWFLENTSGSPAWITKLQLRGKGIYDFRSQVATAQSTDAIAADGLVELNLDQPYVADVNISQGAADMLLDRAQAQGRRARSALLSLNDPVNPSDLLARDFGDRVRLLDAQTALDFQGHIGYVRIELEVGGKATVRWGVVPAEMRKFWILGMAGHRELGINTRVAYF
jgi:hypothetical protein